MWEFTTFKWILSCIHKDSRAANHYIIGKLIGYCPIIIVETLKIREAVTTVVQMGLSHIIVESDS